MEKQFFLIEISDNVTKVGAYNGTIKKAKLFKHFMFQNPADTVDEGTIINLESLTKEFKNQIKARELGHIKETYFLYASNKVIIREINLPVIKDKQIQPLIETNASDYFPVDVSNYYFAYSVIEKIDEPEPALRALVSALPKISIKGYADFCEKLELDFKGVDTESNAIYQLLKSKVKQEESVLYLNIETDTAIATFMDKNKLAMQRTLPFGAQDIANAMIAEIQANQPELTNDYIAMFDIMAGNSAANTPISGKVVENSCKRIINAIERTIELYNSANKINEVASVVITGSYSALSELRKMLEERINIPCSTVDDILEFSEDILTVENYNYYYSMSGSLIKPLNLLPVELTKKAKKNVGETPIAIGILVGGLFILAGLVSLIPSTLDRIKNERELEKMLDTIENNQDAIELFNSYETHKGAKINFENFNKETLNENINLVEFLEELEEKMPSSTLVLSAICTKESVTLNMTVSSFEDAAVAVDQIREFESIVLGHVSPFTEAESELGLSTVSFTANCYYKSAILEKQEAAKAAEEQEAAKAAGNENK